MPTLAGEIGQLAYAAGMYAALTTPAAHAAGGLPGVSSSTICAMPAGAHTTTVVHRSPSGA